MLTCLLLLCASFLLSLADESTHKYNVFEKIPLWVNKVGPFRNPQETYEYYSITAFCAPLEWTEKSESLGEALSGFELVESRVPIAFRESKETTVLCKNTLDAKAVAQLKEAINNQYWFEFFLDGLPIWGWIGEVSEDNKQSYVYTKHEFSFKWKGDQVIEVRLEEKDPVLVKEGPITFTYSVSWTETGEHFEERFDKYLDDDFFEHQIHWFSIFNSFMMVIFLVAVVAMILMKTVRRDLTRWSKNVDENEDPTAAVEEAGWKQVSGDVFRPPASLALFSAIIGSGTQLAVLTFIVISMSVAFYHNHPFYRQGSIATTFIVAYSLTSFVAGYVSGNYYRSNNGKDWVLCMVLTAGIFPFSVFLLGFLLNFIALYYGSLAHIPFGTMLVMLLLWLFVAFPLTFGGTLVGRHLGTQKKTPWITPYPKNIPTKRLHQHPLVHLLLGGILPFGSIFIEMYFVFTAFWQSKYYYVFGFLLLVYIILVVVSVCSTIISTYFLLNAEDYRWQWMSFASSGSTAFYVYLYGIYYFFRKTKMTGVLQTSFYFGYLAMFCFGLALLTGAVGFLGTQMFVKKIFNYIHVD